MKRVLVPYMFMHLSSSGLDQENCACTCVCLCVYASHTSQTASVSLVSTSLALSVVHRSPKSILVAFLQLLADKLAGGR